MTSKRYLAVAGLLAILVCASFGIPMMFPPSPGVTKGNFNRIHEGMTEAEVGAIFGCPAISGHRLNGPEFGMWKPGKKYWDSPGVLLYVTFSNGRVDGKRWLTSTETYFDKFRRWLRL